MKKCIRIATRKSPLALWQANFVKDSLEKIDSNLDIQLVGITTEGDREQSKALQSVGGKSLFVKALQATIIANEADIAVHSIKDMSVNKAPGLELASICKREDPRDALISKENLTLAELPLGAVIGTASPRREAQIKSIRPDVTIKLLRGNVGSRLEKLQQGDYDAIILAVAGLKRLGYESVITEYFEPSQMIPAIGQGAVGIECRDEDNDIKTLLTSLQDYSTTQCIIAEREVNRILGGDCFTPIAAHAVIRNQIMHLNALVGSLDGKKIMKASEKGPIENTLLIAKKVAESLISQGASALL